MKHSLPSLLLLSLLVLNACSKPASRELPPTLMWDKDQDRIRPADGTGSVWEGFAIDGDHFTAKRNTAQFILWRKHKGKAKLLIEYSLQGNKAELAVNFKGRRKLKPSREFKRAEFPCVLNAGFNLLKFSKKGKDTLKIRAIGIDHWGEKAAPHLSAGQGFSAFHPAGKGRLELSGRGTVEIVQEQAAGDGLAATRAELRSGWLSRTLSREFVFASSGLLTVRAKKGRFNISDYSFTPAPAGAGQAKLQLKDKPNIYIVLSDACQASHLGAYGYPRPTSPRIDAFAGDAVVYENAYANAVFTLASVSTLFTGLYPDSHGVYTLLAKLPRRLLTLPEYLQAKGYRTGIITSSYGIGVHFGFTQGVNDHIRVPDKSWVAKGVSILNELRGWLPKAPPAHFVYMHYIHPHFPKVPPSDFPVSFRPGKEKISKARYAQLVKKERLTGVAPTAEELAEITDAYDASIAWVDSEFGEMLSLLKAKKLYDDSLIIFLADHGEALGEHGVLSHSSNVYDETARVPLIVKYPKRLGLKGRVRRLVELADVYPTIASLFGQQLALDGRSLPLPASGEEEDDRMVVFRSVHHSPDFGLRWKNWHYILSLGNNRDELYSLSADPYREAAAPEIRAFLRGRFLAWYSRFRNGAGRAQEIALKSLPATDIEDMKALGYL